MGLLTVFYLRYYYQVERIIVSEPDPVRAALALRLGATALFQPEDPLSNTFTHAFECSARQDAFALLQEALVPHGSSVSCRTGITRCYR